MSGSSWNTTPTPWREDSSGSCGWKRVAPQQNLTVVRLDDARDTLHQGRFAGPVLPQQGVDLTGPNVKADIGKGVYAGKGLAQARGDQKFGRPVSVSCAHALLFRPSGVGRRGSGPRAPAMAGCVTIAALTA